MSNPDHEDLTADVEAIELEEIESNDEQDEAQDDVEDEGEAL